ncbi:hypothetical protein AB1Y20_007795 [Prymnesium parvum]|uniref:Uncharacterized protein n=1 Tax=Prymnesium parvum TaxID=97485 RepID=A0AB34IUQ2_PRYPA
MLVDDAAVFDDDTAAPSPSAPAAASPPSRIDHALLTMEQLAKRPTPAPSTLLPELHVRAPGPHWRAVYPTMSDAARGELLEQMEARAPEAVLRRLRKLARQPGRTGISAWREFREEERAGLHRGGEVAEPQQTERPGRAPPADASARMSALARAALRKRAEALAVSGGTGGGRDGAGTSGARVAHQRRIKCGPVAAAARPSIGSYAADGTCTPKEMLTNYSCGKMRKDLV